MAIYTESEEKELNKQLKKWQEKAKRLILSDRYDKVRLNELQHAALQKLTNAESHKDIDWNLWNSGLIESTLDDIVSQMQNK